jgi:quercetin dioxygenase-like cupin family protein/pyrroloquinoline quinone (PQQ) biosynthesis protein C
MSSSEEEAAEVAITEPADAAVAESPHELVQGLHQLQRDHPFWENRLFRACQEGALGLEDLKLVFSQYFFYSQSFTRLLAGLMANCEDDYFRARISENLWEEGGGTEPEKRHAEIFRTFLRQGLGIEDLAAIEYADFTRHFVAEYVDFCLSSEPAATAAFLSLGTEGIVKRMYQVFVKALLGAGVAEKHLVFFRIHIDCDDGHALTLEEMMLSYRSAPGWRETCVRAMNRALSLRQRFFENLFEAIQLRRLRTLVDKVQEHRSLLPDMPLGCSLKARCDGGGTRLYKNVHEKLAIDFDVTRLPFAGEVLDTRVVRIAPGKTNEMHRHAHESVLFVVQGTGGVRVDGESVEVAPGDAVFVPRWSYHQTLNASAEPMLLLAITDYGLTGRAFVGHYERTARMNPGPPVMGGTAPAE